MHPSDYPQPKDDESEALAETYLPRIDFGTHITHYYGDYVRKLFVSVAAVLMIFAPFFGVQVSFLLPVQIFGV